MSARALEEDLEIDVQALDVTFGAKRRASAWHELRRVKREFEVVAPLSDDIIDNAKEPPKIVTGRAHPVRAVWLTSKRLSEPELRAAAGSPQDRHRNFEKAWLFGSKFDEVRLFRCAGMIRTADPCRIAFAVPPRHVGRD
jgi:hypothetical protein